MIYANKLVNIYAKLLFFIALDTSGFCINSAKAFENICSLPNSLFFRQNSFSGMDSMRLLHSAFSRTSQSLYSTSFFSMLVIYFDFFDIPAIRAYDFHKARTILSVLFYKEIVSRVCYHIIVIT